MTEKKPLIVIPARLKSTRLPNKPLQDIAGKPMIVHVVERALEANIGDVLVATTHQEILETIKEYNVKGVITDQDIPSGSDRVSVAADIFDPEEKYDYIINLQGDLPTITPDAIIDCLEVISLGKYDISTIGAKIIKEEDINNPNTVKAVVSFQKTTDKIGKALYFTRSTSPYGEGPLYQHIGLYGYTRSALRKFTSLKPSILEQREQLEQLRALENDLTIGFKITGKAPSEVNVFEDIAKARSYFKENSSLYTKEN